MDYLFNNRKISFNDFNRKYRIHDVQTGKLLKESTNVLDINSIDEYMEYVLSIDELSNVYYNITKRCNLKCVYCYSEHSKEYVSIEDNEIILDKLEKLNARSITLIGGEPFCHPAFYELLQRIKEKKFLREICIITNGTLIEKDRLSIFKDPRIYLQISLDGVDEETNAPTRGANVFNRVMKNIEYLQQENIAFKLMKVVTRENINTSCSYYDFYKAQDIETGFFMVKQVADDLKPTMKQIRELLEDIYKRVKEVERVFDIVKFADNIMLDKSGFPIAHCGAGINAISINPNGDVYPCVKINENEKRITNLLYKDAVDSFRKSRDSILKGQLVFNKMECFNCKIRYFCGGGCRAEEKNDNICQYNCSYFKLAIDFFCEKKCEEEK